MCLLAWQDMNTTTKDAPLVELWQEINTTKGAFRVEFI